MSEVEGYKLSLSSSSQEEGFLVPILPASIEINEQGNGKGYDIVGSGPIHVIQPSSLSKISFQSYFPVDATRSSAQSVLKPIQYVNFIRKWMNSGLPVRLIYVGTNMDINLLVSIESFDWKEAAGSPGDIEYAIKLQKYVHYAPRKVISVSTPPDSSGPSSGNSSKSPAKPKPKRPDDRVTPVTYKIVAGDTLIHIARRMLGDDSRWREIQKLNGISDAKLRKLQIGQVLKLPKRG